MEHSNKVQLNLLKYFSVLALLGFCACSSGVNDPNTNPVTTIQYQFEMKNSLGKISSVGLQVSSGTIVIREIVFDGERVITDTTTSSVSITHEQITSIDLTSGVATPPISDVLIPAGSYRSVNLGIEIYDETDEPSVVILGTYTTIDTVNIPLRFEFNSGEVFEANASEVVLLENTETTAKITLDPNFWFSSVTLQMLDNAVRDENGIILISGSINSDIFTLVADKLDEATQAIFQ